MPSKRTSNNIDLVEPTQYNVQPNRIAKEPPRSPGRCLILIISTLTILTTIASQIYLPALSRAILLLYSVNSSLMRVWISWQSGRIDVQSNSTRTYRRKRPPGTPMAGWVMATSYRATQLQGLSIYRASIQQLIDITDFIFLNTGGWFDWFYWSVLIDKGWMQIGVARDSDISYRLPAECGVAVTLLELTPAE